MISNSDLQRWIDFLGAQIVALDAMHLTKTGEAHVATPELVAFLKVNDEMAQGRVEKAIIEFSNRNAWPSTLTGDQIVNLTHRANNAKALLTALLGGLPPRNQFHLLRAPRPNQPTKFIQWLLIALWNVIGPIYLEGVTKIFLADVK